MKMPKRRKAPIHVFSILLFALFAFGAYHAFSPNYYSLLGKPMSFSTHFHGISMTLWVVMLFSQAILIYLNQPRIHRWLGKLSYPLMLLVLISGFHIAHETVSGIPKGYSPYYSSVALMFNSLICVAIFYILSIKNLKKPEIHGRYMLCTLIPMITPVTDRLIYFNFREWVSHVPIIDGRPAVMLYGFILANLILILLSVADLKSKKRMLVFPIALAINLIYNISVLYFHDKKLWQSVADIMMGLPLS